MCLSHLVEDRCADSSRRDAVHGDVIFRQFLAKGFRQADHGSLRGAIRRGIRITLLAGDGGHIDDSAVAACKHRRHHCAVAIEQPVQVHIDHLTPGINGIFRDRGVRPRNTGARYEDVDAAENRESFIARPLDSLRVGDIDPYRCDTRSNTVPSQGKSVLAHIPNGDLSPLKGQPGPYAKADARRSTGDDCLTSFEPPAAAHTYLPCTSLSFEPTTQFVFDVDVDDSIEALFCLEAYALSAVRVKTAGLSLANPHDGFVGLTAERGEAWEWRTSSGTGR